MTASTTRRIRLIGDRRADDHVGRRPSTVPCCHGAPRHAAARVPGPGSTVVEALSGHPAPILVTPRRQPADRERASATRCRGSCRRPPGKEGCRPAGRPKASGRRRPLFTLPIRWGIRRSGQPSARHPRPEVHMSLSRRQFLQAAGAAGVGLTILGQAEPLFAASSASEVLSRTPGLRPAVARPRRSPGPAGRVRLQGREPGRRPAVGLRRLAGARHRSGQPRRHGRLPGRGAASGSS